MPITSLILAKDLVSILCFTLVPGIYTVNLADTAKALYCSWPTVFGQTPIKLAVGHLSG